MLNFQSRDIKKWYSIKNKIIELLQRKIDEVQELHNNAVQMLGRAIGVDVLTTFADVNVEDMTDSNASVQTDDLERVERQLYNEAGVSQMQFNSDSNTALNNSILNDEASMYDLLLQFESFLNLLL